ncbi:MAG: ATP-grasp domain-containing protein [Methanosarcinaceae archaeon]
MKILISEYAVSTGLGGTFLLEGRAMLRSLASSFSDLGHDVHYTTAGALIDHGTAVSSNESELGMVLERESRKADAAIVIAPDDLLAELTAIIEDNTLNLGCSADTIALCTDKLECGRILGSAGIDVPRCLYEGQQGGQDIPYVVKPRYGCASEDTWLCYGPTVEEGYVATEYVEGEHVSVSLIAGDSPVVLTINKQLIDIDASVNNSPIGYRGSIIPYRTGMDSMLYDTARGTSLILGCRGYVGIDIIVGDRPYVIDVNPRPTTSLVGICKVIRPSIADLLLRSRSGEPIPPVEVTGSYSFNKEELI